VDGEDDCEVRGSVASVHFELIDTETHATPLVDGGTAAVNEKEGAKGGG
jgi:hypothetical protein